MEKPDIIKPLMNLYENNKQDKRVYSKEKILKLSKYSLFNHFKYYYIDVFSHQSDYYFNRDIVLNYKDSILFGFKSGVFITKNGVVDCVEEQILTFNTKNLSYDQVVSSWMRKLIKDEMPFHKKLDLIMNKYVEEMKSYKIFIEKNKVDEFDTLRRKAIKAVDKNENGIIDVNETDSLIELLELNQKKIIKIDRTYVQKFIKISEYLNDKRENLQLIFEKINNSKMLVSNSQKLKEEISDEFLRDIKVLENSIHSFNMLLFASLSMITSLVNDDMIKFYQIEEIFDKLSVFESNWEKEMKGSLKSIDGGIGNLVYQIQDMSERIVYELGSIKNMSEKSLDLMEKEMGRLNNKLDTNNLLNSINTYQLYKLREK